MYPLFVPCNGTQSLSPTEKTETEQDLRVKLEAMLGGAQEVLQDVILSEVRHCIEVSLIKCLKLTCKRLGC